MKGTRIDFCFGRVIWSQGSTDFLSLYLSIISASPDDDDDDDDDVDKDDQRSNVL